MPVRRVFSVLVADDDRTCRESVRALLEAAGYRTFLAETGGQALEFVDREPVHLVILDQFMPDITGSEALRRICEMRGLVPSIIMSGELTKETKLDALNAGAFTFVSKPIQTAIMRHAVQQAFDRYYPEPRRQ